MHKVDDRAGLWLGLDRIEIDPVAKVNVDLSHLC